MGYCESGDAGYMKIIALLVLIIATGPAWISPAPLGNFASDAMEGQSLTGYVSARLGDFAGGATMGQPLTDRLSVPLGYLRGAPAAEQLPSARAFAPLGPVVAAAAISLVAGADAAIRSAAGLFSRLPLGAWQWPVLGSGGGPPKILRGFHPPAQRWLAGHRGVDLAAPEGSPVLAAGPGTVSFAGTLFGKGVVVISHGSVRTSYEPVKPTVHVGDAVARGSPIGTLVAGHCPGQACLHWGRLTGHRHGVRYYDPLVLLGLSHLRLEPVG
jgi:murein DD-endopeptidase MepM/ murein hydrolase activator NlpD